MERSDKIWSLWEISRGVVRFGKGLRGGVRLGYDIDGQDGGDGDEGFVLIVVTVFEGFLALDLLCRFEGQDGAGRMGEVGGGDEGGQSVGQAEGRHGEDQLVAAPVLIFLLDVGVAHLGGWRMRAQMDPCPVLDHRHRPHLPAARIFKRWLPRPTVALFVGAFT